MTESRNETGGLVTDPIIVEALKPVWINRFVDQLQLYSPWTNEHSLRVGKIDAEIGLYLGFADEERVLMAQSGILHDIGKIYVPTEVLDKPNGKLTEGERLSLDKHPRSGFTLILPFDEEIASIIVAHHELHRRNYPRRTQRTNDARIDTLRRTLALSDSTDALLSERPYKKVWGVEEARQELGLSFEPDLIEVAIQARLTL